MAHFLLTIMSRVVILLLVTLSSATNNKNSSKPRDYRHCEFMKKYTDTALHVYFAGNLRIYKCDVCCSRWYFKFNSAECSSPGSIDSAFFMWHGRKHSLHRHRHIEGHCNNIHKGKVRVGFWVGKCTTGRKSADAGTGWGTMSRIFIEEVPKAQQ